jgi:hypothetical protein
LQLFKFTRFLVKFNKSWLICNFYGFSKKLLINYHIFSKSIINHFGQSHVALSNLKLLTWILQGPKLIWHGLKYKLCFFKSWSHILNFFHGMPWQKYMHGFCQQKVLVPFITTICTFLYITFVHDASMHIHIIYTIHQGLNPKPHGITLRIKPPNHIKTLTTWIVK